MAARTKKDEPDLALGLDLGVDLVAMRFVQSAHDVDLLRSAMDAHGEIVPIVAKLERPQALADIDAILDTADAVMVARGDLGVELQTR